MLIDAWGLYEHRKRVCIECWLWERKKSLAALGTGTHVSIVPGFSVGRCSYPAPLYVVLVVAAAVVVEVVVVVIRLVLVVVVVVGV